MVAATTAECDLTLVGRSAILEPVLTLARRLCAIGLVLALAAGNGAVCAGWAPTPEARMACCSESGDCPMHKGGAHHSGGGMHQVTQAQADSCCASSESQDSRQSSPTSIVVICSAVLGPGVVIPEMAPASVLSDAWRTSAPIPLAPVPKHVLLSVFLV